MKVDKRELKYVVKCEKLEAVARALRTSCYLMEKERNSTIDCLQAQEYKIAMGIILEVRESLLNEISAAERTDIETRLTLAAVEIMSHSQLSSTTGGVSDNEGISEASLLVQHSNPISSKQDFLQRFSQLSNRLNRQLVGLLKTNKQVGEAADRLSASTKNLAADLGTIEDELHRLRLKPEPGS